MKKLRTFSLLTAALLLGSIATAGPVTPQRAAAVAGNFWREAVPTKTAATLIDRSAEWNYDGIYLFTNPTGGFVLVAADDAALPILGYSPTSTFDPVHIPVQLREWLDGYQQHIDWLRDNDGQPYAAATAEWQALKEGLTVKGGHATKSVEPLITTHWDQDYPYNLLCPPGTYTGCAATAQAQMMKFWEHPSFGFGNHSYVHPLYGTQSADFGNTVYDWQYMPDQPHASTTDRERLAIATLMYHVGVSLDMSYGNADAGGSGALGLVGEPGFASIDNSLKDYFGYSPDMQVVFKNMGYTNEQWRDMLIADLDLGHPIIYTGSAEQGGHGFICDGYDSRGYMHFNFGWSGTGDGYYPVDSISPGVGGAGGNVTYTFNYMNAALLGAVPVYNLRVSDTLFNFTNEGAIDSVLFASIDTCAIQWHVSSSADWLTIQSADFERAGWVHFEVAPNDTYSTRSATLTFTQDNTSITVKVMQSAFSVNDMCPLTVVMEATHGNGWLGDAYLSLESEEGFRFGIARLEQGTLDSVTIYVAQHDVYSVWHSGGPTDRYINYYIRNQYGENEVEVEYAYLTGGTHLISWPCVPVGIDEPEAATHTLVYPNPVNNMLHIEAEGLHRVEVLDMTGRKVITSQQADINVNDLPAGPYFVYIVTEGSTSIKRIVKQ